MNQITGLRDDFFSLMNGQLDRPVVEAIIRHSLPNGSIISFEPIIGEGVSNNTQLFRFGYLNGRKHDLVVKIGRDIGINEQIGRQLLNGHFPLPTAYGHGQDHAFIYDYVPGNSVNALIAQNHHQAARHYRQFLKLNLDLWRQTLQSNESNHLAGYPQKVESTMEAVFQQSIIGRPVCGMIGFTAKVNSMVVPSLSRCLQRAGELICQHGVDVVSSLQHGDEGASNFIVHQDDGNHFVIDNGVVGQRLIEEGVAKLIMWWAITARVDPFEFKIRSDQLIFDYQLVIPEHISQLVGSAISDIFNAVGDRINQQRLSACVGLYLLRELQWTKKRNANLNGALIAMALEAFSGMFTGKLCFPGFTAH